MKKEGANVSKKRRTLIQRFKSLRGNKNEEPEEIVGENNPLKRYKTITSNFPQRSKSLRPSMMGASNLGGEEEVETFQEMENEGLMTEVEATIGLEPTTKELTYTIKAPPSNNYYIQEEKIFQNLVEHEFLSEHNDDEPIEVIVIIAKAEACVFLFDRYDVAEGEKKENNCLVYITKVVMDSCKACSFNFETRLESPIDGSPVQSDEIEIRNSTEIGVNVSTVIPIIKVSKSSKILLSHDMGEMTPKNKVYHRGCTELKVTAPLKIESIGTRTIETTLNYRELVKLKEHVFKKEKRRNSPHVLRVFSTSLNFEEDEFITTRVSIADAQSLFL